MAFQPPNVHFYGDGNNIGFATSSLVANAAGVFNPQGGHSANYPLGPQGPRGGGGGTAGPGGQGPRGGRSTRGGRGTRGRGGLGGDRGGRGRGRGGGHMRGRGGGGGEGPGGSHMPQAGPPLWRDPPEMPPALRAQLQLPQALQPSHHAIIAPPAQRGVASQPQNLNNVVPPTIPRDGLHAVLPPVDPIRRRSQSSTSQLERGGASGNEPGHPARVDDRPRGRPLSDYAGSPRPSRNSSLASGSVSPLSRRPSLSVARPELQDLHFSAASTYPSVRTSVDYSSLNPADYATRNANVDGGPYAHGGRSGGQTPVGKGSRDPSPSGFGAQDRRGNVVRGQEAEIAALERQMSELRIQRDRQRNANTGLWSGHVNPDPTAPAAPVFNSRAGLPHDIRVRRTRITTSHAPAIH